MISNGAVACWTNFSTGKDLFSNLIVPASRRDSFNKTSISHSMRDNSNNCSCNSEDCCSKSIPSCESAAFNISREVSGVFNWWEISAKESAKYFLSFCSCPDCAKSRNVIFEISFSRTANSPSP